MRGQLRWSAYRRRMSWHTAEERCESALLVPTEAFEAHVDSRNRSGEFNLPQLARALGKSLAEARAEVAAQIRPQSKDWLQRLSVDAGIEAMITVSHGFKRNRANPAAGVVAS